MVPKCLSARIIEAGERYPFGPSTHSMLVRSTAFEKQEENASLRKMQNADGQLSVLTRPRTTLHKVVAGGLNGSATTTVRETKVSAAASAPTTLCDGRYRRGSEQGVTLEPSPKGMGFSWNQGESGAAAEGKAWAAAPAPAPESGSAVDGRRELSLKQLHVKYIKCCP